MKRDKKNNSIKKMSFLKIADPVKRERIVKEFLEIKQNIRANELAEKTGKIELREELSELFKPVTETQNTTAREITEGLRPIKEGIEQLPQRLPQQIGYPFSAPPSYRSSSPVESGFGEEEELSTTKETAVKDHDTTFGFYRNGDKLFWGDKQAVFSKEKILIGNKYFKRTSGLWELITSKNPREDLITEEDKEKYAFILGFTNTMHRGNNPLSPYPKASRSQKWEKFVRPIWERFKGQTGSGIKKVVIPGDPNSLLERLDLLMASKAAGNTGLRNELVSVCDELKRQGILGNKSYKKIMSLL